MNDLHQLVFGYDDGHRLLAGSIKLLADTQAQLLSTTDADPGDDHTCIITGLPLPAEKVYALCFTWRAPELPRPGSVWAHVLLFSAAQLRAFDSPYNYATLARRPSWDTVATYKHPLIAFPLETTLPKENSLLEVSDLILRHRSGTIKSQELQGAADAFGFLWGLQWPALRSRFKFRTRHVARAAAGRQSYQVVRKIDGGFQSTIPAILTDGTGHTAASVWRLLDHETDLRTFMFDFGPENPATIATFASLHDIYWARQEGDARNCRRLAEHAFPSVSQAKDLKAALFSRESRFFTEGEIVQCLLEASVDAWNLDTLQFRQRLREYVNMRGIRSALAYVTTPPAPSTNDILTEVVRLDCNLQDLVWIYAHHAYLFEAATTGDVPALRSAPDWRRLGFHDATKLLLAVPLTSNVLAAAIQGRQSGALIETHSHAAVLAKLIEHDDARSTRLFLTEAPPDPQEIAVWDVDMLLFAAACQPDLLEIDGVPARLEVALDWRRGRADRTWMQAAVSLFDHGGPVADHALIACFGPLHSALTDNRLPGEAWRVLDAVLPPGKDTSLRLRSYLLDVARYRDWSTGELLLALRDAGPFAHEAYWPKRMPGDPMSKRLRKALKVLGMASM